MERVEDPFRRIRSPGLTEIVIGWGRIWSACSLRSSLRIRQEEGKEKQSSNDIIKQDSANVA
jgi:hypothetical protein